MLDMNTTPKIDAACLASYNAGFLHGRWIEATTDVDEMAAAIRAMLKTSPCPNVMRSDYESDDGDQITRDGEADEITVDGLTYRRTGAPYASAEEYAFHDHEGLGDLGEYESLAGVARRVEIIEAADSAGIPSAVLIAAMDDLNHDDDDAETFIADRYRGHYDTWAKFAEELTEETHDMDALPDWARFHIDWESMARDFQCSGEFSEYDGHFFWAH